MLSLSLMQPPQHTTMQKRMLATGRTWLGGRLSKLIKKCLNWFALTSSSSANVFIPSQTSPKFFPCSFCSDFLLYCCLHLQCHITLNDLYYEIDLVKQTYENEYRSWWVFSTSVTDQHSFWLSSSFNNLQMLPVFVINSKRNEKKDTVGAAPHLQCGTIHLLNTLIFTLAV